MPYGLCLAVYALRSTAAAKGRGQEGYSKIEDEWRDSLAKVGCD